MRVLGIDPGVSGAAALVEDGALLEVADMPVAMSTRADGRIRRKVDPVALAVLLRGWRPDIAIVEHVHASPGMGVSSAFAFGHTAGSIDAVLAVLGCDPRHVSPPAWKRAMAVPADKTETRNAATAAFGTDEHWQRIKDHGRAEAALLALYGSRLREQGML
jgi:crossover junction endodeoxyribonuclease RuvC